MADRNRASITNLAQTDLHQATVGRAMLKVVSSIAGRHRGKNRLADTHNAVGPEAMSAHDAAAPEAAPLCEQSLTHEALGFPLAPGQRAPAAAKQRLAAWFRGKTVYAPPPPFLSAPDEENSQSDAPSQSSMAQYQPATFMPAQMCKNWVSGTPCGKYVDHRMGVLLAAGWLREEVKLAALLSAAALLGE